MPKINYDTVEKSEILSKVVSLKKVDENTVQVKYDCPRSPEYVKMDYAKELSKKYGVEIA